ncbi:GrpB family protein [Priestia taiwanensis]|uniref:GrpB family protein n=1 Tax=Priestia taiwanensis TaxID=1347902 RepID=A0A917ELY8_9BACI|nr:GrpB family protein [Priestia taiwanensis]MBM7361452.1 GrpB-like predicted nucleotidyltransferase (UPF0157 family) [Priestia taiwanensis]GGE54242.1 hypothetical protein GCM10007140_00740 [Priestia taiwanensis]
MEQVEIIPYEKRWERLFQEEAKLIKDTVEKQYRIYHIGSTSIPGMPSTPIIDLLMVVENLDDMCDGKNRLARIGYEALGERNGQGRCFFMKDGGNCSYHLHIFQQGNKQIERHLIFREFMIANREEAERYACQKEELAERYQQDRQKYTEEKKVLLNKIDRKVEQWTKEADKP